MFNIPFFCSYHLTMHFVFVSWQDLQFLGRAELQPCSLSFDISTIRPDQQQRL